MKLSRKLELNNKIFSLKDETCLSIVSFTRGNRKYLPKISPLDFAINSMLAFGNVLHYRRWPISVLMGDVSSSVTNRKNSNTKFVEITKMHNLKIFLNITSDESVENQTWIF